MRLRGKTAGGCAAHADSGARPLLARAAPLLLPLLASCVFESPGVPMKADAPAREQGISDVRVDSRAFDSRADTKPAADLLKGDAIPKDAKAEADLPKTDLLKADLMKPDSKTSCAYAADATFSGLIASGASKTVSGYDFYFTGKNAGGDAIFDVKCAGYAVLSGQACPEDVVTTLSAPSDGRKFLITPHTVGSAQVDVSISVTNI